MSATTQNAFPTSGLENRVWHRSLLVLKESFYLRDSILVYYGGTVAVRNHAHYTQDKYVNPIPFASTLIKVTGPGTVRQEGVDPVGAIYGDGGKSGSRIPFQLQGDTWVGARGDLGGYLRILKVTGGSHSFIKVGPGMVILGRLQDGSFSWGKTEIRDGVLSVFKPSYLPAANIALNGGFLDFFNHNQYFTLGIGNNQIQWTGDGGLSGRREQDQTAPISFHIGSYNSTPQLTWGQQYFVGSGKALLLSSRYANVPVHFANAINLGTGAATLREVRVERGANATAYGRLTGALSGSAGLLKTGPGLLWISGANTYTGQTVIREGVLRGAIANGSRIVLEGGVLGLDGDFSRRLGNSGAGRIRWNSGAGGGGFAAYGGQDRSVSILGATEDDLIELVWGSNHTTHFLGSDDALRFGHYTASGTVVWKNPLKFNGGAGIWIERSAANAALGSPIADVRFSDTAVIGWGDGSVFGFYGDGRIDIESFSSPSADQLDIRGAELWLRQQGGFESDEYITLSHGGSLIFDNIAGGVTKSRLHEDSTITFETGNLSLLREADGGQLFLQKVDTVDFRSGANTLGAANRSSSSAFLFANTLYRSDASRSTLHINAAGSSEPYYMLFADDATAQNIGGIVPWITIGGKWGRIRPSALAEIGNPYILSSTNNNTSDPDFHEGAETTWLSTHNVRAGFSQSAITLSANRNINSLILERNLNLNNRSLILGSGGLLIPSLGSPVDPPTGQLTITNSGSNARYITTPSPDLGGFGQKSLYLHIYNERTTFTGKAGITAGRWGDIIKTGPGDLYLNSDVTHVMHSLYIHQGTVRLQQGKLDIRGTIYIGDGAGTDVLWLYGDTRNQLRSTTTIVLHGTPYLAHGSEYGGPQAILRMGGNTKQHLSELHIKERGTIDWEGGEVAKANILYLDKLSFSGPDAVLFMYNWYEYEDFLLVKKGWFNSLSGSQRAQILSQVHFEGYENFPVIYRNFDATYWQITPFGVEGPEPETYGAILGAAGIALVLWRKKRRGRRPIAAATDARITS